MMQTKLAIMYEDIVYPITMSAISSVGSLMDCNSAFKRIDDCQLGSAILLTEKLAYMNKVQLVYRESSSKIRPLMAVAGGTYVHIPLNEFFRKIHDKISERHLFKAERWSITDSGASWKCVSSRTTTLEYRSRPATCLDAPCRSRRLLW